MQEDNSVEKCFKSAHSPTWKLNQEKQTKKKKKKKKNKNKKKKKKKKTKYAFYY